MKSRIVAAALSGAVLGVQATTPGDCLLLMCRVNGIESDQCKIAPSNLTAKIPNGFSISSIRSHTYVILKGDKFGEQCVRIPQLSSPVSLDRARVYGAISVTGHLKTSGIVRY
jgi:hypothetical protein